MTPGLVALGFALIPVTSTTEAPSALQVQVQETERAFARTMARRDLTAFAGFLDEDAVFFSGPSPLRGKAQILAWWKRYFSEPEAPFSWAPERVAVLDSGTLALSTGPVRDASGKVVATFTSIWRQESPGVWRIIFDKGDPACEAPKP